MVFMRKSILKKSKGNDDFTHVKEDLEKGFNQLKENVIYGQQLIKTGSWTYDIQIGEIFLTDEVYNILECSPEMFDGRLETYYLYVHPHDLEEVKKAAQGVLKGTEYDIEYRIKTGSGSDKYVHEKTKAIFDEDNNLIKIIGVIQDVTKQKLIENNLREIGDNLKHVERVAGVGSFKYDLIKDAFYGSEEMYKIFGIESINFNYDLKRIIELTHPDDQARIKDALVKHLSGEGCKIEFRIPQKDGTVKYVIGKGEPIFDKDQQVVGILGTMMDITERVEMENKIAYIATHDELTGLPNRTFLKDKLEAYCQFEKGNKASFALMMLDIDGFKYINDALGYEMGDKLFIEITQRLKQSLDDKHFICRYSGDKFAIVVKGPGSTKEYESIAKAITALFSKTFRVDKYELDVTVSMGISIYHGDEQDADLLIKYADIALLWAKNEGRNRYKFYSQDINIQSYKQFELRNDLRKALEKGQFKAYYQPMVNLKTSEILAAEALIRWEHPEWGILLPHEFIPLAEENGIIIDIGKWMLREVCRHYKEWMNDGMPGIKLSINFSSIQFYENDFVKNIKEIIREFGLDPHFLIMEITEKIFIRNADKAISDIKELQAYGIQIALDDFGTGFSSLSYLSILDIDILKIDGSFIKNILLDETNTVITRFIVNMAQKLRIKLVAKGIETWKQLTYLRKLNCYAGQGYLFCKPVPLSEFEKVLSRKRCRPVQSEHAEKQSFEERRRFFRVEFLKFLEADMTILEIKGEKTDTGSTKVLIKDIGAGGMRFISDIRLPVSRDIIFQFKTQLIGEMIRLYGCTVWTNELDSSLYEYGIEFTFDENDRMNLIRILNQVQIKMRKNIMFADGNFVSGTAIRYFKHIDD